MSTCAGAELPEPASRTPAAVLVRIRRPLLPLLLLLLVIIVVVVVVIVVAVDQLPLLLLALLPLLCLVSIGLRRNWREGLDERAQGGDERVTVVVDGPTIIIAPLFSRAAAMKANELR